MTNTCTSIVRENLTFFSDSRSRKLPEIQDFLASSKPDLLAESIRERAFVVLGGDGLFVQVAKEAHRENVPILGINFGTKGFLLHDQKIFEEASLLAFETRSYPMLHADIYVGDEKIRGHAFNEIYVTRAGDASSIQLSISQKKRVIQEFIGDGVMLSTPAGSTGWSRSYGGVILPHDANLNALTPIGKMAPGEFAATVIPDKWRVHIKNDTTRLNPIDILVDNRRIISMETRPFELIIERSERAVRLLIEKRYQEDWDMKTFREIGFSL